MTLEPEYPKIVMHAVPLFITLALLEILVSKWVHDEDAYETRDTAASLSMGVVNLLLRVLNFGVIAHAVSWAYDYRIFELGHPWWAVLICWIIYDFMYYWRHRWGHEVRWFWASHIVHHSSQHYNLSTALRQTWTGGLTGLSFMSMILAYLGFHPHMIGFCAGINLIYQFWIHTERITHFPKIIEWIFNTPSHHRVHHGSNPRYLDANYAGTFIIWDRIFGSFVPEQEEDEQVKFGLVHDLNTFNPLRIAFHEYASIFKDITQPNLSLSKRLAYIFAPPGWSHDGSTDMVPALKAAYVHRHPESSGAPGLPTLNPDATHHLHHSHRDEHNTTTSLKDSLTDA